MSDKLDEYRRASKPAIDHNQVWPLYGTGLENFGKEGRPMNVPLPAVGPDELLVRHDACGLCFSDIKVINLGERHPRIYRDMRRDPVVLGHEVTMTVVDVGEHLKGQYHPGDRFIIQSDIFVNGVGYAYGYEIQGGLSRYGILDQRILNGDHGNYLIPIRPDDGYAETALTEPWACVVAAYQLDYRSAFKNGGTAWIIGTENTAAQSYSLSQGFDENSHPARLLLSRVPEPFARWLRDRAAQLGVVVTDVEDLSNPGVDKIDDMVVLDADAELIETVSPRLARAGILAIVADEPLARPVQVDIGRIHYDDLLYVGSRSADIADAYREVPVRSTLQPGGRAWFVGAGGPMGHMHVQRAIQLPQPPHTIICTDVSDLRLDDLCTAFSGEAEAKGIEFVCLNPTHASEYQQAMRRFQPEGIDDIVILAPVPAVVSDSATYLAERGVMNIFAGVGRGTMARIDLGAAYQRGVRICGHTASTIDDLRLTLNEVETGRLSTNRSVAAIGSLGAARDGLQALKDATYPGKVVIFPNIKEMPLTALTDLKDHLPNVYSKLRDGREWTLEAEAEFLRTMLED